MVKDRSFYRSLLYIALPVALKALLSRGVPFLDNLMVASLGTTITAAVSQANQITNLFSFFVMGVGGGASVLVAQYWGKQDTERIKSIFSIVFMITACIGICVTALVFFFPVTAMGIFTDQTALIEAGIPYLTIISFTYICMALSETMTTMLRCVELVQVTLWSSVVSLGTNLLFNYILIYGKFGFPALGAEGAAIATLIARIIELGIVTAYLFGIQKRILIKVRDLLHSNKQMWQDFLRFGAPIIAGDMQWGAVLAVKSSIIGRLGEEMIVAYSITDQLIGLAGVFAAGFGGAACVMIGKATGEGNYKKTREYSNSLQILFACSALLMCAFLFFTRGAFVSLYTNISSGAISLAKQFLGIASFTYLGTFYHATCFTGINRGAGDGKFVFFVDMICGWCIVIPLSLLAAFVFRWPLPVVFLCLYIDQCFKWSIAFFRLRGNRWIRNVTRA